MLFFLFSVSCLPAAAGALYSSSDLYIGCKTDPRCAAQFYLVYSDPSTTSPDTLAAFASSGSYERKLFSFLLGTYLDENGMDRDLRAWPPGASSDADRTAIWLPLLRRASFCDVNHEYMMGSGCRCKTEDKKGCDRRTCSTLENVTLVLAVVLCMVIAVFHAFRLSEKNIVLGTDVQYLLQRVSSRPPQQSSRVAAMQLDGHIVDRSAIAPQQQQQQTYIPPPPGTIQL